MFAVREVVISVLLVESKQPPVSPVTFTRAIPLSASPGEIGPANSALPSAYTSNLSTKEFAGCPTSDCPLKRRLLEPDNTFVDLTSPVNVALPASIVSPSLAGSSVVPLRVQV